MGTPNLLKGYIFHKDGFGGSVHDMVLWGRPTVHANSIRVEPGIFDFYVGEPFVSLKRRRIDTLTIGQLVTPSSRLGNMGSWGLPCVPDVLGNRSRTKGKRTQGTIKNHRSGSAARQGGAPTLPTSAAIDRVLGENGKKLFFLLLLL
jgi:hypothetical protein